MRYLIFLLCVGLFAACGGDATAPSLKDVAGPSTTPIKEPETTKAPDGSGYENADELRVWVNRLAMRATPAKDGARVAILNENKRVTPTGKVSPNKDAIVLRGTYFVEPWYEVKNGTGQTAWVFGGGLTIPGKIKGQAKNRSRINEPIFGDYDLTKWEKITENEVEDGGDFNVVRTTYKNVDRLLTIRSGQGEYAYFKEQLLTNLDGEPLMTREIRYDNSEERITETVTDYAGSAPKVYTRSVATEMPYQQMQGRVERLTGKWTED